MTGYQAHNSITVTKNDVAAASKLLQVALSAGVNEMSALSFEVSDPSRGRDRGLRAAYEDARAQAALLARAAGRTLGRAIAINTGSGAQVPAPPRPIGVMAARAEAISEVPVESGSRELSFMVSVVFEMR